MEKTRLFLVRIKDSSFPVQDNNNPVLALTLIFFLSYKVHCIFRDIGDLFFETKIES